MRMLAARCRKLEMLGECCGRGEEKDAFALILEALNVHVTSIPLGDEAASLTLGELMKREEYLSRLIGALTRLHRDCYASTWSPGDVIPGEIGDEYSIVLSETLPVEVRAVVYEIQIHTLLGLTAGGHYASARSLCQKAMDAYVDANCPLRHARVVERLLYLGIVEAENASELLTLGAGAVSALISNKVH